MKVKLTLSVDEELIRFAKQHARSKGESVSTMFSEMLMAQKDHTNRASRPSVADMLGSLSKYNIDDSKDSIRTAYAQKNPHRP
jgi:hypothetical protein